MTARKRTTTKSTAAHAKAKPACAHAGPRSASPARRRARALVPAAAEVLSGPMGPQPMRDTERLEIIALAMEELRAGSERGAASQVWGRISDGLIFEAASDVIVRQASVEAVVKALHGELAEAGVSDKSFGRLLSSVRNKAREKIFERIRDTARADDFKSVKGDPKGIARLLNEAAAEYAYRQLKSKRFGSQGAAKQHGVWRVVEACRDMLKIIADSEHKGAQTDKLREVLKKAEAEAAGKSRGKGLMSRADAFRLIRQELGIDESDAAVKGVAA